MFTINLEDGREALSKASIYINLACLIVWFVSNKRQNGWTDQAQI